jgi:hypothetical protein
VISVTGGREPGKLEKNLKKVDGSRRYKSIGSPGFIRVVNRLNPPHLSFSVRFIPSFTINTLKREGEKERER